MAAARTLVCTLLFLAVAASLSAGGVLASSPPYPCTFGQYDLSGMYRNESQLDYEYVIPDKVLHVNVCGDVKRYCSDSGSCLHYVKENTSYDYGKASEEVFKTYGGTQGVVLNYPSGSECPGTPGDRSTTLYIQCDQSIDPGIIDSVNDQSCNYKVYMRSKYACKNPYPPAPPMPALGQFQARVYATCKTVPDFKYFDGKAQLAYSVERSPAAFLVNGSSSNGHELFGTLVLENQARVATVPGGGGSCQYSSQKVAHVATLNKTVSMYFGQVKYQYLHFSAGKTVSVDAWGFIGNDTSPCLYTDPSSGSVVWAMGYAFLPDLASADANAFVFAQYEFDPASFSTDIDQNSFIVPSEWGCS